MKKLLYVCVSLMCLALAAGTLMVCRAGALRLMRDDVCAGTTVQTAAPAASSDRGSSGMRVYAVDFERVMKDSASGRAVHDYAKKYEAVMAQNIALLNRALADKKKKYDVSAVKKMIAQYSKRKSDVWADARVIIRGLVRAAVASSPLKDALLFERKSALYLPEAQDRTDDVIRRVDLLKLSLPEPPKPVRIEPSGR